MRNNTKQPAGHSGMPFGKSLEQIERENERSAAIEELKGLTQAQITAGFERIYGNHLPKDMIDYLTRIFFKHNK